MDAHGGEPEWPTSFLQIQTLRAGHVTDAEIAAAIDVAAARVARIKPPCHRKPEVFHEERSEVAHELRQLADRIRHPKTTAAPTG
jgi:hypothetical protein